MLMCYLAIIQHNYNVHFAPTPTTVKMEIKLLSCPLCLQPHFQGVDSLRSTLVSVATSNLSCPVCNETLLGLDKLTIHLFSHINQVQTNPINNQQQEIIQEEIDQSINKLASSQEGKQPDFDPVDNVEEPEQIRCDICSFSFTDQNILDMHQKLLHQTIPDKKTGLYSYHCHLCSKKFKMRGSLMVHLRVAHYGFGNQHHDIERASTSASEGNLSKGINCVKDEKVEVKAVGAKVNGLVKVMDNKQWECDVCAKMFTTKYFLKKHKRLHTGEMPYSCTQCNKSFTFQQSYHKHMLYHSSEKPYVCTECGRAFKELSTLQNHTRIHSGERPFACETCGKRFRQRVSYLVHRRIHTGVMPYKCTACEKTFRYKVSQRSHKCPMSPPGSVVRIPDVDKMGNEATSDAVPGPGDNVKCIMSVDYNTGSINFIPESKKILFVTTSASPSIIPAGNSGNEALQGSIVAGAGFGNFCELNISTRTNNISGEEEARDLFSVLSPLLPEVASLCLSNSPSNSGDSQGNPL